MSDSIRVFYEMETEELEEYAPLDMPGAKVSIVSARALGSEGRGFSRAEALVRLVKNLVREGALGRDKALDTLFEEV